MQVVAWKAVSAPSTRPPRPGRPGAARQACLAPQPRAPSPAGRPRAALRRPHSCLSSRRARTPCRPRPERSVSSPCVL
ncbi:unnamed protein product [Danaus chrysippus]|uniref:(African queen) hypothetical protein n=1 Tax=Danaus chrysippus TaxID=151541 RepID=A0A8J2RKQ0_9NEOP|nr:unnamed protein product [Danaus chrysippus]